MARKHVLVVEDEEDIQELIRYNLAKEGYQVDIASSGEEALRMAKSKLPDLVLLDLMLPGVDGLEVCKLLKNDPKTQAVPVVMLTAKGEETDIVIGLELGADDYIAKPFSPKVLIARLRTILRRKEQKTQPDTVALRLGELAIDPVKYEVTVSGKPVELTATEFRVLHFLARRPGWVFTRQQIVDAVRGEGYAVTERSVDVQMVGLRRKLGACAACVETVRGIGYRFQEQ